MEEIKNYLKLLVKIDTVCRDGWTKLDLCIRSRKLKFLIVWSVNNIDANIFIIYIFIDIYIFFLIKHISFFLLFFQVEVWLNNVTDAMKRSVRYHISQAVATYDEKPREQWIFDHRAQPALCGTQIWWTTEVNMAFMRLEEGFENAFKDYQRKQINQLNALIVLLCGDLSESDRRKIMTICTIDVHARDVVAKMIAMKADHYSSFQWQSQLRHR